MHTFVKTKDLFINSRNRRCILLFCTFFFFSLFLKGTFLHWKFLTNYDFFFFFFIFWVSLVTVSHTKVKVPIYSCSMGFMERKFHLSNFCSDENFSSSNKYLKLPLKSFDSFIFDHWFQLSKTFCQSYCFN